MVKSREYLVLLIKQLKTKQRHEFLGMVLSILGNSLLGNIFPSKGAIKSGKRAIGKSQIQEAIRKGEDLCNES